MLKEYEMEFLKQRFNSEFFYKILARLLLSGTDVYNKDLPYFFHPWMNNRFITTDL